jgi:hypothetical protein
LNKKINIEVTLTSDSGELQEREIKRFVYVMIVFTIGMAVLDFFDVSAWWIWYIYFALWTLIEYKIAKNINLKWWYWVLIIIAIISIDLIVLELMDYLKK